MCSLDDCDRPASARGWCGLHYARWRRYGDASGTSPRLKKIGAGLKFIEQSIASPGRDCIIWPFGKDGKGYGCVRHEGKQVFAHRLALAKYHRLETMPHPDIVTRHVCNTPACINPLHTKWGSHKENAEDRVRSGRCLRGERNAKSKLGEDEVIKIRAMQGRQKDIGKIFNITQAQVSSIKRMESWAWLPG